MYYTQEQIDRANQTDLVLFLQSQGEPLERAGQEYRWKRHDSLTVRGNKWYRHSQSKGGAPIDFVMEFYGKSFTEAVELLTGEKGAAPPPDRPTPASFSDFRLPPRSPDNRTARNYLTAARRIDEDVTGFFFATGDIYEEAAHHNAVFVGRDEDGVPRYAHQRGTAGSFRLDVKGSDKAFNFCYRGEGERLFVFEAPVDLLSFLCLFKKAWQKQSYLSLGGVGEKALLRFLSDRPNIKTVYLCLDSDQAGSDACSRLAELVPEGLTVHRLVPLYKDWNEVLQHRAEITDGKYLREAIYGLKEPPQEETVEIIRMSEVDTQTVEWLWEPYIPFGKVTIVQGNPGEGKTTFALRLAAACTTGGTLPGMKPLPPFQVIYQTAEDGLGDTVKPRLIEAEADLDRVLVIDEAKRELTLSDERIEKAITQNGARLIILDPIQAYMGEKTDMNRANEVRPMINSEKLTESVLAAIRHQVSLLVEAEKVLSHAELASGEQIGIKILDSQITALEAELERYSNLKIRLYQDLCDDVVSREEYGEMNTRFAQKIKEAQDKIQEIREKKQEALKHDTLLPTWLEEFKQYEHIKTLERRVVVELIDHIDVHSKTEIEIHFCFEDELHSITEKFMEYQAHHGNEVAEE